MVAEPTSFSMFRVCSVAYFVLLSINFSSEFVVLQLYNAVKQQKVRDIRMHFFIENFNVRVW